VHKAPSCIAFVFFIVIAVQNATAEDSWRTLPLIEGGKLAGGWKHVG
jgi:hypothetical protein